jgi:hypothetical protein
MSTGGNFQPVTRRLDKAAVVQEAGNRLRIEAVDMFFVAG